MSLPEIRDAVLTWTGRGQSWGEAMLIGVKRSAPRSPGARYAVGDDGSFAGTISAGCVEADVREHILSLFRESDAACPRVVSYGISDEMAAGVDLACGGEIEVLIRAHEPDDPVWAGWSSGSKVVLISGPTRLWSPGCRMKRLAARSWSVPMVRPPAVSATRLWTRSWPEKSTAFLHAREAKP